jgi:hypothetical protein
MAIDPTTNIFFTIAQKILVITLCDGNFLIAFDCQSM